MSHRNRTHKRQVSSLNLKITQEINLNLDETDSQPKSLYKQCEVVTQWFIKMVEFTAQLNNKQQENQSPHIASLSQPPPTPITDRNCDVLHTRRR